MRVTRHAAAAAALASLALVTATACSSDDSGSTAPSGSSTSVSGSATSQNPSGVEVRDAWIKATDSDMTGVFGTIHNGTDAEVHVVGVSSELSPHTELHETVPNGGSMTMQEAKDGYRIPASGELELKPGANHVMLMGLTKPITTGQEVTITLELADGTKVPFQAAARSFKGGNENYQGGEAGAPTSGAAHSGAQMSGAPASGGTSAPAGEHSGHDHG